MRHFLADDDLSPGRTGPGCCALAAKLKADPYAYKPFEGPRSVAVLFDKPTLRTQSSFAAGIAELGGYPMIVDGRLAGIGERESVTDVGSGAGPAVGGDRLADVRPVGAAGDGGATPGCRRSTR